MIWILQNISDKRTQYPIHGIDVKYIPHSSYLLLIQCIQSLMTITIIFLYTTYPTLIPMSLLHGRLVLYLFQKQSHKKNFLHPTFLFILFHKNGDPFTANFTCISLQSNLSCGTTTSFILYSLKQVNNIEYYNTTNETSTNHSFNNFLLDVTSIITSTSKNSHTWHTPQIILTLIDNIHTILPLQNADFGLYTTLPVLELEIYQTKVTFGKHFGIPIQ